jgi:hypothetical protein
MPRVIVEPPALLVGFRYGDTAGFGYESPRPVRGHAQPDQDGSGYERGAADACPTVNRDVAAFREPVDERAQQWLNLVMVGHGKVDDRKVQLSWSDRPLWI